MPRKTVWEIHNDHEFTITEGTAPHAYQLRCKQCDAHIQWLNFSQALMLIKDGCVSIDLDEKEIA